jgi:uncharacterized protein YjbJ (UPF0337 family)
MSNVDRNDPSTKAAVIRNDIESTRADMSRTVNQIEERLSPAHLKEQVMEQFHDAKDTVMDELRDAKETVKDDLAREFAQAKGAVREEIQDAKAAVREATLGKVEHMAQDVRHMANDARDTISDAGTSVVDTIRANPIPAALIAVGIGWLLMGRRTTAPRRLSGRRGYATGYERELAEYDYGASQGTGQPQNLAHRVQEGAGHLVDETRGLARNVSARVGRVAHDASDTVGRAAHDAGETVGRVAHDARDMAVHFADDAQMTAGRAYRGARTGIVRAERGVEDQLQENPLAVGAVALAIGAAIGLALPHTRQEDEWMGKTKDRLLDRAEGAAHEAIAKVEEVAGDLTEKLGPQAKDGMTAGKNGSTQSRSVS